METLKQVPDEQIKYAKWKSVEVSAKGRSFKRMKFFQCEQKKMEFIKSMETELDNFREHVKRVATQYEEVRRLKQVLPINHVICQMDFAS